jgi:hypothetical protein
VRWSARLNADLARAPVPFRFAVSLGQGFRPATERTERTFGYSVTWEHAGWEGLRPSFRWDRSRTVLSHPRYGEQGKRVGHNRKPSRGDARGEDLGGWGCRWRSSSRPWPRGSRSGARTRSGGGAWGLNVESWSSVTCSASAQGPHPGTPCSWERRWQSGSDEHGTAVASTAGPRAGHGPSPKTARRARDPRHCGLSPTSRPLACAQGHNVD